MFRSQPFRMLPTAILAAATALMVACGGGDNASDGSASGGRSGDAAKAGGGDSVTIGFVGPLTGRSAAQGLQMTYGVKVAIKEANEAGGINGKTIEGIFQDDESKPDTAALVAQRYVQNPNVVAIVGHFNSDCSNAGAPVYNEAEKVQITPASTNVTVTIDRPYTFRNIFNDRFQGHTLADYVGSRLNKKKAAVLYENDAYGKGLYDSFKERVGANQITLTNELSYESDTTDYRPLLAQVKTGAPEVLVVCGLYKSGAQIARQAKELGLTVPIIGGEGLLSDDLIKLGGDATEGMMVTVPFMYELAGERGKKFQEAVQAEEGVQPDAWAALSYDAANLLIEAMREIGSTDSKKIQKHLASINSMENAFPGLTGPTYFDEQGDCLKPVAVAIVKDGKFQPAPVQMTAEMEAALAEGSAAQ